MRLLERRHLAAGATGKSGALVRMHYTNEHESRLALEGLRIFRDFGAIVGGECGFQAPGFLQLVPPGYEAALRRNLARQQHLGVDTREVSREEVRGIFPELRTDTERPEVRPDRDRERRPDTERRDFDDCEDVRELRLLERELALEEPPLPPPLTPVGVEPTTPLVATTGARPQVSQYSSPPPMSS